MSKKREMQASLQQQKGIPSRYALISATGSEQQVESVRVSNDQTKECRKLLEAKKFRIQNQV